jgi:transposase
VKPFVKRQTNDAADAEAIAEAASRATMRFVPVKSAAKQGACMVFKARDLLVRQRTQTVNALHEHLAEYGVIAPQGLAHLSRLATAMDDAKGKLPAVVIALCAMLIEHIACLGRQIAILDKELRNPARRDELAKRLMTIPVGKVIHAILDNYATHKNSKVQRWLANHPRWVFQFTPTSASWLNAVESFFSVITRRRIRRGVFRSVGELEAAIRRYTRTTIGSPSHRALGQQPCEGNLRRRRVFLRGVGFQPRDNRHVLWRVLSRKTREARAEICLRIEHDVGVDLPGQEAFPERRPRNKADPQLLAGCQNAVQRKPRCLAPGLDVNACSYCSCPQHPRELRFRC